MNILLFTIFTLTWKSFQLASLPSYLHPCKQGDITCMTKEASNVVKSILKGDKNLGIPKIDPLILPSVEMSGGDLLFAVKNFQMDHWDLIKFKTVNLDVEKKTGLVDLVIPKLVFTGEYTMKGKFAMLNLDSGGNMTINVVEPTGLFRFKFDVVDGFAKITESSYDFTVKDISYNFDNIINGNPELSKATNDAVNEDPFPILNLFRPGFEKMLQSVFHQVWQSFFDHIKLNKLVV